MSALFVDSVDHSFGKHQVLNNVFLNCNVGEVVGVLGRNGCGKSTLLKIIFGSLTPHFMHMKIDGELTRKGYLSNKIAYLPQGYFIPHYLKIEALIDLYVHAYKEELLQLSIIKLNLKEKIGNLSGGNRRLVEALLIIYNDAKYILLDEPFSQLAPAIIEELKIYILRFKEIKGFIVTDHYYQQVLNISSRVVLIHNASNYKIDKEEDLILHGYLPS